MGSVKTLTRNTKTSTDAVAKRAAELVVQYLPDVIARVVEVDKSSGLNIGITVKPAGRTEAAKDPQVIIRAKPDYGDEVVTIAARLTGEGDSAQLSLIQEMVQADTAGDDAGDQDEPEHVEAAATA